MSYFLQMVTVALTAIFIENTIFARAFGTSTLIVVSRNRKNIFGFGLCVTYITAVTGIVCYFIDKLTAENELNYIYKPFVYILSLGLVYIITLLCLWQIGRAHV